MRIPTHRQFVDAFGEVDGSHAYGLAKGLGDCRLHPAVTRWAKDCYHDPRDSQGAYSECLMLALNAIVDGFGVESIRGRYVDRYHFDIQACYVNTGDTYETTLLLDHETNRLRVTSYGDWVETHENREIL